jgi:hypothetical protein
MEVRIATILSLLIFAIMRCSNPIAEPHLLSIESDRDSDYLGDGIESYFGLDSLAPDTDGNGVLDGVQLACDFFEEIRSLPRHEIEYGPYVIEDLLYGLEMCSRCDVLLNMGHIRIINQTNNSADTIPFVGLHYLSYGGFRYKGEIHEGDIDPVRLFDILNSRMK